MIQQKIITQFSRLTPVVVVMAVLVPGSAWGEIDGSAGGPGYYQQELSRYAVGSGTVGADGRLVYSYPMGAAALTYADGDWFVQGYSAISRSTKWGVPQHTDDDIFTLDGQEIVYASGTNPRLYHTENESYLKITYHDPGLAASYWQVIRKDGSVSTYGKEAYSRIERTGLASDAQPRAWAVDTTRDAGNYNVTRYRYEEDNANGGFYLTHVIEGKTNASANGYKCTRLYYKTNPYPRTSYREATQVKTAKHIKTVATRIGCDGTTGTGGNIIHAWAIGRTDDTTARRSTLTSITPYGGNVTIDTAGTIAGTTTLQATKLKYGAPAYAFNTTAAPWTAGTEPYIRDTYDNQKLLHTDYRDMNGDGLPDRIHQETAAVNGGVMTVALNTGTGFGTAKSWGDVGERDYLRWTDSRDVPTGQARISWADLMDMNGDGLPDRVEYRETNPFIYFNRVGKFGPAVEWWDRSEGGYSLGYMFVTITNGMIDAFQTVWDYLDMNGDGLPDRIVQGGGNQDGMGEIEVYFNNGSGLGQRRTLYDAGRLEGIDYIRMTDRAGRTVNDYIDMNGDGLPDRVVQNNGPLQIYFNNGHLIRHEGFNWRIVTWPGPSGYLRTVADGNTTADYMDVNNDGLPDRVEQTGTVLTVWLNTGEGFAAAKTWTGPGISNLRSTDTNGNTTSDYLDINADGFIDRVSQEKTGTLSVYLNTVASASVPSPNLLAKVTESSGGVTTYAYRPLDRDANSGYKLKRWVIKSVTQDNGLGTVLKTSYSYSGATYDSSEREDRGFREVVETLPTGEVRKTYYYQDDLKKGLVEKILTKSPTGKIFSYVYNTYVDTAAYTTDYANSGTGPFSQRRLGYVPGDNPAGPNLVLRAVKLSAQNVYAVDGSTDIDTGAAPGGTDWKRRRTVISYTDYGDEKQNDTGDYTPGSYGGDRIQIKTAYAQDLTKWLFAPSSQEKHCGSVPTLCGKKLRYYDSLANGQVSQGLLTRTESYYDAASFVTTQATYDADGNVATETDANGNQTTYAYDSTYRSFLKTVTKPQIGTKTFITTYGYDSQRMRLTSVADPNGNTTSYEYDDFGRKTKEIKPGDNSTSPTVLVVYHDYDGGTAFPWTETKRLQDQGNIDTIDTQQFMDGFGALVQTKAEAADNFENPTWRTVDIWDYVSGNQQVKAVRTPYFTSSPVYDRPSAPPSPPGPGVSVTFVKKYLSDTDGRVTVTTDPSDEDTYADERQNVTTRLDANSHKEVTVLQPGQNETVLKELKGDGPYSLYATTTVKRTFDSLTITDGANRVVHTEAYDWLGRMKSMTDTDLGSPWTFTHKDNGELLEQTDPKGQKISFTYDAHNRVKTKTYLGDVASNLTFDYDRGADKGLLYQITDETGNVQFLYDTRNRVISESRTIYGDIQTTRFQYDSMDRMTAIRYPGDTAWSQYTFDPGGQVQMLRDASGASILDDFEYDALGRATYLDFPSSYSHYDYFDESGNHRLKTFNVFGSAGRVATQTYAYDSVGNVGQIDYGSDGLLNQAGDQAFTYDDLDRLTGQTNAATPGGVHTYTYDTAGNMTVRDAVTYTYGAGAGVHAVTSLSNGVSYQYDANGNMTNRNGQILTYNYDNQLTSAAPAVGAPVTSSMGYGPDGSRAWKFENGVFTQYFNRYFEKEGGVAVKYYYVNGMRIAEDRGGVKRWYHADHLGSTMNISDRAGAITRWIGYQPFGPDAYDTGTGTTHKYTDKEKDGTGLYYYGARFYDPVLCRFITADARYDRGPQGLNRYSYVLNNPLKYNDPTGNGVVDRINAAVDGVHEFAWQAAGDLVKIGGFGVDFPTDGHGNLSGLGLSLPGGPEGTGAGVSAGIQFFDEDGNFAPALYYNDPSGTRTVNPGEWWENRFKEDFDRQMQALDRYLDGSRPVKAPPTVTGPALLTPAQVLGDRLLPGFLERQAQAQRPIYRIVNVDFSGATGSNSFQRSVNSNRSLGLSNRFGLSDDDLREIWDLWGNGVRVRRDVHLDKDLYDYMARKFYYEPRGMIPDVR